MGLKKFIESNPINLFEKAKVQSYTEHDIELKCPHCGCKDFKKSKSQLNTASMSLIDMDFANPTVRTYRCENCHYLMFFDTYEPGES